MATKDIQEVILKVDVKKSIQINDLFVQLIYLLH
jgi:hypothetical protein